MSRALLICSLLFLLSVHTSLADAPAALVADDVIFEESDPVLAAKAARPVPVAVTEAGEPRGEDGDGSVKLLGEIKQWHKVTLQQNGPFARETDKTPNPFLDYRMTVRCTHESGTPSYRIPGYFAADGNAAETSAGAGNKWRVHVSPDKPGRWDYVVSFVKGERIAIAIDQAGTAVEPFDGRGGSFHVVRTNKRGRDLRGQGRLQYVGQHYLRFAGSGEYFLKAGPDAPETLLAYADFDGTQTLNTPLKTWRPHEQDWRRGDPTWQGGKGKGLIGALNYIASKGCNAFSFLPYNTGGDGQNVRPFIAASEKLHFDCSKLDQWQMVFDHAQSQGLYLHFKLQEQENDDNRSGNAGHAEGTVPAALDNGDLGIERKLYCRELVARFAHELALNWNLGEENTQSPQQQREMAQFIKDLDPYDHHIVVHTFPGWQDRVYTKLLGDQSVLTGASLQNSWQAAHQRTLKWVVASAAAGRPWVCCNDEQGPASLGVPQDPGYEGTDGKARDKDQVYDLHDIRKRTLWGTLMAGGAGVEYYFGYTLPQNDLVGEDWRSRDKSWDYCGIALEFFKDNKIPFWEMQSSDALIGNANIDNSKYCFAKPGELYVVYLPSGGSTQLDLSQARGRFSLRWFNPRAGGELQTSRIASVRGGSVVRLGNPPADVHEDWLVVARKE